MLCIHVKFDYYSKCKLLIAIYALSSTLLQHTTAASLVNGDKSLIPTSNSQIIS